MIGGWRTTDRCGRKKSQAEGAKMLNGDQQKLSMGWTEREQGHPRKSAVKKAPGGEGLNLIPNAEVCEEK